jgi:hypothetical protein
VGELRSGEGESALRASAGALKGVDTEQLLQDIYEARSQDSAGPTRESTLLEGFGAAKPHDQPEDWAKIRKEMEAEIAGGAMTRGKQ